MKIKVLGTIATVNGILEPGTTVEVSDAEAEVFVDCGSAEYVAAPKPAKEAKAEKE
jgi:hypothetical protein